MVLDPGKMRDRIRLQRRLEPDGWGETIYETIAEVWSEFRPGSGREFRDGNTIVGEERGTFACNYREGLKQVDRVIHLGRGGRRVWNIRSVAPVNFKESILILAVATDDTAPEEA